MERITKAALSLVRAQDKFERARYEADEGENMASARAELYAMQRAVAKIQGVFAELRSDPVLRPVHRELRGADVAAFRLGERANRALAILEGA